MIPGEICQAIGDPADAKLVASGAISDAWRVTFSDGSTAIVKLCRASDPPPGMFAAEATGLRTLKSCQGPRTPEVRSYGRGFLCLEDLGQGNVPVPNYWERFGREVAKIHSHTSDRFGFDEDNFLGRAPMDNSWRGDGHAFFVETRVANFLDYPLCDECLTSRDRQDVEKICDLIKTEIPKQGPCLIHGDLWFENTLVGPLGEPCVIDPATYYGWPEAELSMTRQYPGIDEAFFGSYREVHPLEAGWEKRLRLLEVRELLSMIAHNGNAYNTVPKLRELLREFVG